MENGKQLVLTGLYSQQRPQKEEDSGKNRTLEGRKEEGEAREDYYDESDDLTRVLELFRNMNDGNTSSESQRQTNLSNYLKRLTIHRNSSKRQSYSKRVISRVMVWVKSLIIIEFWF